MTENDLYWAVGPEDAFDLSRPPGPVTGQLGDDLEELNAIAGKPDAEVVTWHDLGHLLGLLDAIVREDLPG